QSLSCGGTGSLPAGRGRRPRTVRGWAAAGDPVPQVNPSASRQPRPGSAAVGSNVTHRRTAMLHRILASLATLALLAYAPAHGRPLVDVSVVDRDTGEWLSPHPHRGDVWVAGTPGHRYSVRLANTTGERVLVVLSVDG